MRPKKHRQRGTASIPHYAPDVGLVAADYVQAISPEQRLNEAEKKIRSFLKDTNPDSLCECYMDRIALQEDAFLVAFLRSQQPAHRDANLTISSKHCAELTRLNLAIGEVGETILQMEEDIKRLSEIYEKSN